jgi:hypothetical protein
LSSAPRGNRFAIMQSHERVLAWLELNARAAWLPDIETYLAEATDLADLERRMKLLYR